MDYRRLGNSGLRFGGRRRKGCRSDNSDVGGQGPTNSPRQRAAGTGPIPPAEVPYVRGGDSLDATQALEHFRRLQHASGEWTPTLGVAHQGIHHRWCPGEFLC
jgi:hypothetical protein